MRRFGLWMLAALLCVPALCLPLWCIAVFADVALDKTESSEAAVQLMFGFIVFGPFAGAAAGMIGWLIETRRAGRAVDGQTGE